MRGTRLTVLIVLLLGMLAGAPPGTAATVTVVVDGMAFSPATRSVAQGTTVTWDFRESGHTTTSNQGFWDSGFKSPGQTVSVRFLDAGRFAYRCRRHASMGMVGAVVVPMRKAAASGGGWTLRWSSRSSTPSSRSFDVQVKAPGSSTWKAFRTSTTARTASFHPSRSGTYSFRARTDNRTSGTSSGWSPALAVPIG
jgi:plastocyanin